MKKIITVITLAAVSAVTFALNCGNLGIRVINATHEDCTLHSKNAFYGIPIAGLLPVQLAAGASSDEFFMQQDNTGIGIQLGYMCNNKKVKFYSYQEYCGISAGEVGGVIDAWNELSVSVSSLIPGSWWSSSPGHIVWVIQ